MLLAYDSLNLILQVFGMVQKKKFVIKAHYLIITANFDLVYIKSNFSFTRFIDFTLLPNTNHHNHHVDVFLFYC